MPLILLPMNPSDIPTLISIQNDALDTDPLHSLTMALPHSAFTINAMEKRLESELKDPTSGFMTVVDTDIRAGPDIVGEGEQRGRVIALARWHFYTKERPEEEWNVKQTRVLGDEINWPLLEAFLGPVGRCRREYVKGRRHALLNYLVTHPDHQRRGAGDMLTKWGTEMADKEGLECWLESSSMGEKLYTRNGFEEVEVLNFDMEKWGAEGTERYIVMRRPAKGAGN